VLPLHRRAASAPPCCLCTAVLPLHRRAASAPPWNGSLSASRGVGQTAVYLLCSAIVGLVDSTIGLLIRFFTAALPFQCMPTIPFAPPQRSKGREPHQHNPLVKHFSFSEDYCSY